MMSHQSRGGGDDDQEYMALDDARSVTSRRSGDIWAASASISSPHAWLHQAVSFGSVAYEKVQWQSQGPVITSLAESPTKRFLPRRCRSRRRCVRSCAPVWKRLAT